MDNSVPERIAKIFTAAAAEGFLHVREVGGDRSEVAVGADVPVVLASVFKIVVAVAFAREVCAGRLDETERVTVDARYRIGGVGSAGCIDDVTMSWRDLAMFMVTMSDNAATDVLYHRLGQSAVDAVLDDLGLRSTRIVGCCEDVLRGMAEDLGFELTDADLAAQFAAVTPQQLWSTSALDPVRTSASTPREITGLLESIWTDRAAPAQGCHRVRAMMSQQIWPQRLSRGFDSSVSVAGKIGTLPGIRNEVGVLTYPDGKVYAVAVFTRSESLAERQPMVDDAIGLAARTAVDHLRSDVAVGMPGGAV